MDTEPMEVDMLTYLQTLYGRVDRNDEIGRRAVLSELLGYLKVLTVNEAWSIGYLLGFYYPGDGYLVKGDLKAVGVKRSGWWRFRSYDPRNESRSRWFDFWTAR